VVHTPELQAYTASKLYNVFTALRADISHTLSATWVLGEYSDLMVEGGVVDDEKTTPVWADKDDFDCF
jgi:AP-1 complex subunit gamma-1